jgi:hypothetical protein
VARAIKVSRALYVSVPCAPTPAFLIALPTTPLGGENWWKTLGRLCLLSRYYAEGIGRKLTRVHASTLLSNALSGVLMLHAVASKTKFETALLVRRDADPREGGGIQVRSCLLRRAALRRSARAMLAFVGREIGRPRTGARVVDYNEVLAGDSPMASQICVERRKDSASIERENQWGP